MQKTSRLNRLLAVLVAAFMAVCCLPLNAFAEDEPKSPAPLTVHVSYGDAATGTYVGDGETIEIMAGTYSVDYLIAEGYLHIPEGYKPTNLGNVDIYSNTLVINVESASVPSTPVEPATVKVDVSYYDAAANQYVGDGETIEIVAGPYSVDYLIAEGYLHIPEGYKPTNLGNVDIYSNTLVINVESASVPSTPVEPATVKVDVSYYDAAANQYVGDGETIEIVAGPYSVDYLIAEGYLHIPEGYKPTNLGNVDIYSNTLVINVESISVPSTPVEPAMVKVDVSYYDVENNEYVAESETFEIKQGPYSQDYLVSEGYIHIPEGYDLVNYGNVDIYAPTLVVNLKPTKTLRIYWAIDNGEAADFADGSADTWTQELSWKHINDEIAMPEITVKDGYVFNGWSVGGQNSEFWGPELATMTVGDKFVADEKGGVISITANIVTREAGQGGSTGGNNGGSTGSSEQSGATATAASAGNDTVVKTAAPADNSVKILPQTGFTAEAPAVFGGMLFAALAGAGAYLFGMRKKLNETF